MRALRRIGFNLSTLVKTTIEGTSFFSDRLPDDIMESAEELAAVHARLVELEIVVIRGPECYQRREEGLAPAIEFIMMPGMDDIAEFHHTVGNDFILDSINLTFEDTTFTVLGAATTVTIDLSDGNDVLTISDLDNENVDGKLAKLSLFEQQIRKMTQLNDDGRGFAMGPLQDDDKSGGSITDAGRLCAPFASELTIESIDGKSVDCGLFWLNPGGIALMPVFMM